MKASSHFSLQILTILPTWLDYPNFLIQSSLSCCGPNIWKQKHEEEEFVKQFYHNVRFLWKQLDKRVTTYLQTITIPLH